jgi:hypothetical protein
MPRKCGFGQVVALLTNIRLSVRHAIRQPYGTIMNHTTDFRFIALSSPLFVDYNMAGLPRRIATLVYSGSA